jgi:hypothetical protein
MTENNNSFIKTIKLDGHKTINKQIAINEEIEYWQDKLLDMKLIKVKEDYEYNKRNKQAQKILDDLRDKNKILRSEVNEMSDSITEMKKAGDENLSKQKLIKEEIHFYEEKNSDLFNETQEKFNFMRNMQTNPDFLLNHILQFDMETLKALCIRLNKLGEEKMHQIMKMQQQHFYNQIMNQGRVFFPPVQQVYNVNSDMKFEHNGEINSENFEENSNAN